MVIAFFFPFLVVEVWEFCLLRLAVGMRGGGLHVVPWSVVLPDSWI